MKMLCGFVYRLCVFVINKNIFALFSQAALLKHLMFLSGSSNLTFVKSRMWCFVYFSPQTVMCVLSSSVQCGLLTLYLLSVVCSGVLSQRLCSAVVNGALGGFVLR